MHAAQSETSLTREVIERLKECENPRLHEVFVRLIQHLHAFVREVEPTESEWLEAIEFLTSTGQTCSDQRQEYILLSDVLGVSMLVDELAHRRPSGATPSTVLGPFYRPGSPTLPYGASLAGDSAGEQSCVHGQVLAGDSSPIAGAVLDVWQTDGDGLYDVQHTESGGPSMRGKFETDPAGRFAFWTVRPVSYSIPSDGPVGVLLRALGRHPFRPAHVHMIVSAPGFETLTTHLFVASDPYLESDAVFGVKPALIVPFEPEPAGIAPDGTTRDLPFLSCHFDIQLAAR